MNKLERDAIIDVVTNSYIYCTASGMGYRIIGNNFNEPGGFATEDELEFYCAEEDYGDEVTVLIDEVDIKNDLFYRLELCPVPEVLSFWMKQGAGSKGIGNA